MAGLDDIIVAILEMLFLAPIKNMKGKRSMVIGVVLSVLIAIIAGFFVWFVYS